MAAQNRIEGDMFVTGNLSSHTFTAPAGAISNAGIAGAADIDATKLEHQHSLNYQQANGTAVVAATQGLFICRGLTGTIVAVQAAITGLIATGGDRTVDVDVKKGDASTAYTTVLSAPIQFTNADALRTPKAGTVSVTSMDVGDSLIVAVAVAGAAGNQAQGLQVTVTVREDAS